MSFDKEFFGRHMFYDRDGNAIDMERYGQLHEAPEYFRVAEDNLEAVSFDGEWYSMLWVSTVWIGINMNYSPDGPPVIFETMVFVQEDTGDEIGCMRYATEQEALEGHRRTVECLQANQRPFAWAEINDRS